MALDPRVAKTVREVYFFFDYGWKLLPITPKRIAYLRWVRSLPTRRKDESH